MFILDVLFKYIQWFTRYLAHSLLYIGSLKQISHSKFMTSLNYYHTQF